MKPGRVVCWKLFHNLKENLQSKVQADLVVAGGPPVPTPRPHFPILPEASLRDLEQSPKDPGVSLLKHLSLRALAASLASLKYS